MPRALGTAAIALILGLSLARAENVEREQVASKAYRWGEWQVVETASFQVCCPLEYRAANDVATTCESMRKRLQAKWLGVDEGAWKVKCQVILHRSAAAYLAAVGKEGGQTVGSSLVNTHQGQITSRRIDLRADKPNVLTAALPHEMTHVVLSDHFVDRTVPHWADEGMAILADPEEKQARHRHDLDAAMDRHKAMSTAALVSLDSYPTKEQWGAFYGQSASLVEYLVSRESPSTFIAFLERASKSGYDAALRETYGIEHTGALDHLWRRQLTAHTAAFAK